MLTEDKDVYKYLLSNFQDKNHVGQSLIDIYMFDPEYFKKLVTKRQISIKAALFCAIYEKQLTELKEIKIDAFRVNRIENMIDEFLTIPWVRNVTWNNYDDYAQKHEFTTGNQEKNADSKQNAHSKMVNQLIEQSLQEIQGITLKCPYDGKTLHFSMVDVLKYHSGKIMSLPIFTCDHCKKKFSYSQIYPHLTSIHVRNGARYININPKKANLQRNLKPSVIYIPTTKRSSDNIISSNRFESENKVFSEKDKRSDSKHVEKKQSETDVILNDDVQYDCFAYHNCSPDYCKNRDCNRLKLVKTKVIIDNKQYVILRCPKCNTLYIKQGLYYLHPEIFNLVNGEKNFREPKKTNAIENSGKKYRVKPVDIVVRGNTFRCNKLGHKIEIVVAIVPVIRRDGTMVEKSVPAGYCRNCHTYFIREGTFRTLQSYGIIGCRVKEEQFYYSSKGNAYSDLADQSILMEYGYSVSSTRNLSSVSRHKILSMLMDYKVLNKSQIINYLEFFIRQRKNQKKDFKDAIDKWKRDIDYVNNYHNPSSQTVYAKSIKHRKYEKK